MPAFQDAVSVCKTKEDVEELSDYISSFVSQKVFQRGNHTMNEKGTSFFGEHLSNKNDSFERKKFAHEKRRVKRTKRF